jgi:hypothetical protein
MEASLGEIMGAVRQFVPNAVVFEEADGNVAISLNMKLNESGLLETFIEEEVSDEG